MIVLILLFNTCQEKDITDPNRQTIEMHQRYIYTKCQKNSW